MPRSKLDLLAEVLEKSRKETTKTKIVTSANLNQTLATHSLNLLVNLELLTERHNSPTSYCTTEKGIRFLSEYRHLQKLLDSKAGSEEDIAP